MPEIIECVPNFSEGRDMNVIKAITDAIEAVDGVKLLDVDPGADTNRTVVTFIGTRQGILDGAYAGIAKAAELIDMRKHSGAHARLGATDVCPLVPISGISEEECIQLSYELARKVADGLNIPVYMYEKSARREERRNLANIRAGEYEGLADKLKDPNWQPDFGKAEFNERSGATVMGVREFLIAYNVNLNTTDRKLASDIALTIREKGRLKRDKAGNILRDDNGVALRQPGLLKETKAVGWYIDEYKMAQVSINLTNYKITPPHVVFEEIRKLANRKGLRVTGSEIVGLIPLEAILMAGRYYLKTQGKSQGVPEESIIRTAIQSLGLNDVSEFDPQKKIIEYQFREFETSLVEMTAREFADETSTDSPAPGGGSVAALCGSLAASLTAMVANLTHGKKGYERHNKKMNEVAVQAQNLKDELLRLMDLDTAAFNQVMDCFRLPRKTDEDKAKRNAAIQEATKNAANVPLQVMETSLKLLELTEIVAKYGNVNSISDAGVAALSADTAINGAGLNVLINLAGIDDREFVASMKSKVDSIRKESKRQIRRILNRVEKTIAEM
ncbi:MAG: glutamate formimidoyltransferase [Candidatus Neomarinimicrobiota bacterium]|nr:MAG: glutamate formimidoyltransferase [Candidatus Neomarinimicrobiota bacterium]